ncbi:hypothetical protein DXG01_008440 [Tephrocybe rancida]|nr:hypothetical protein DXG01_008440 [Tephrocybe rancida]
MPADSLALTFKPNSFFNENPGIDVLGTADQRSIEVKQTNGLTQTPINLLYPERLTVFGFLNTLEVLEEAIQLTKCKNSYTLSGVKASPVPHMKFGLLHTHRSTLPLEVLDIVIHYLPRPELLIALRASRMLHDVAKRVLYHTIEELDPVKCVTVLIKLDREPSLQSLVRKLDINWTPAPKDSKQAPPPKLEPTRNLYSLLHRVLTKLKGLTSLSIELPRTGSQIWILDHCTFSLRYFSTSMPCDARLAQYLDTQPLLTELTLRGCQQDMNRLPLYLGLSTGVDLAENMFRVLPTSLPKLNSLRIVHGGPSIISSVVEGRPVQLASIALYASTSSDSLKALSLSAASLRRLSIMSFDPGVQDYLFLELTKHFPHLEALHVVLLLSEYTYYLTFMANTNPIALPHEEQIIARIWHQSCPTLKTIILPLGNVWFAEGQIE